MPRETVVVSSEDFGGLSYTGSAQGALELSEVLRPMFEQNSVPNYLRDFLFALEVECQEQGLLDDDFSRTDLANSH